MKKAKERKGITLIALVITIIVLLILASITIATLTGDNGILKKATEATNKTEEAKIKEEIELAIMEIQIEEGEKLNKVTLETLAQGQLENKLEGITSTLNENEITGEYKGYEYKIDENFKITIEKIQGIRLKYTTNPKGYTNGNITLTIEASSTEGEITKIEVPDTLTRNDDNTYTITKNGSYEVTAIDSKGNSVTKKININKIDKVEPLDFTISKENIGEDKVKIIAKAEDGEATQDSVKSGIEKYEYYVGETKYESLEESYVVELKGNTTRPEVYVIAYDKAGNPKRSTNSLQIGRTFYVSSEGSDASGDGGKQKPYANIAKAVDVAQSGDSIEILPGEYQLDYSANNPHGCHTALSDQDKQLVIYGYNEKTIIRIDAAHSKVDSPYGRKPAIYLSDGSVLRNLTVVFEPVASDSFTGANNAIFYCGQGMVENVFFRTIGANIPSYLYNGRTSCIKNCTFFHDLGQVTANWNATALFTNIATNVETKGENTNVITESFGTSDMSLEDLIKASKENTTFQENQVGIYYGEHAWK